MGYLLGWVVFVLLVPWGMWLLSGWPELWCGLSWRIVVAWVMMAAGLPLRNENTTSQLQQKRQAAKQNKKRESQSRLPFFVLFWNCLFVVTDTYVNARKLCWNA